MKYKSFSAYARDICWASLKPGGTYGYRRVLKVDRKSVTHIGSVIIKGSLTPAALCFDDVVQRRLKFKLREKFKHMIHDINQIDLKIESYGAQGEPARWSLHVEHWSSWNYRYYTKWYLTQLPITIDEIDVQFIITNIYFDVKHTLKANMPADTLAREWFDFQNPIFWLTDIDGHYLNDKNWKRKDRVGLYRESSPTSKDLWQLWEVPDTRFVPVCLKYNPKSPWAFFLPFLSVYNSSPQNSTAMGFDGDDFLPNPQKRRDLFDLVKKSDSKLLDAYFNEQEVHKYTWNKSDYASKRLWSGKEIGVLDRRWLKVKAITAHQPNTILGSILVDGDWHLIKFTLEYFGITATELNQLKVGRYCAVEHLARTGRLSFVSFLVHGKLKLAGKVFFSRKLLFQRVWSVVFAALDVENLEYLRAAILFDKKGKLLHLRAHRGLTALGPAVMKNKIEQVRVLVEARADVNQPSWGDESVLCLGLQFGVSLEIIEELVQAGAKVTGNDLTGNSIVSQLEARRLHG